MSSFITTTATTSTRHDSTYDIDSFLPSGVYPTITPGRSKYSKMGGSVLTSTPTADSQSNLMTYDCLPEQQTTTTTTTPTGGIPLENLSIQHSIGNTNEWISGLNYSAEYSPQDMNFLFAYNDLVIANKDMANTQAVTYSTPSESSVISINDDIGVRNHFGQQIATATPMKSTAEQQQRRYSLMDVNSSRAQQYNYHTATTSQQQHGQWIDSLFYQQPTSNNNTSTADNMIHKERSSMPNVFIASTTTDNFINGQQQQQDFTATAGSPFSWQQQNDLLQKKPMSSNNSTPIKEKDEDILYEDFSKYNFNIPTVSTCSFMTPSSSVSSPLKQHIKKRSIVDDVLHEEEQVTDSTLYTVMPSIVSSMSEPIPTSTWAHQPLSRKRTKSSMRDNRSKGDEACHPTDPSTTNDTPHEQHIHPIVESHENYNLLANDTHDFNSPHGSSTHVLAAMPRRQKLRYEGDHYTPKWVRYTGHLKEGYCDSCNPGKWLQLKNSAYWYHKQFYHGISSVSGKLFIKPIEQRMGKGDMIEGLCHQCHRYVPACNGKKKNNYMLWYRHAHKCHLYDKPKNTSKVAVRKLSIASSSTTSPVHTPSSSTTAPTTSTAYIS